MYKVTLFFMLSTLVSTSSFAKLSEMSDIDEITEITSRPKVSYAVLLNSDNTPNCVVSLSPNGSADALRKTGLSICSKKAEAQVFAVMDRLQPKVACPACLVVLAGCAVGVVGSSVENMFFDQEDPYEEFISFGIATIPGYVFSTGSAVLSVTEQATLGASLGIGLFGAVVAGGSAYVCGEVTDGVIDAAKVLIF